MCKREYRIDQSGDDTLVTSYVCLQCDSRNRRDDATEDLN